jgi:hypothetical protein
VSGRDAISAIQNELVRKTVVTSDSQESRQLHELLGRRWLGVPDSRAIWQSGFLSEVDPTVVRFPGTGGRRRILGNREQFRAYKVPTPRKFEY